MTTPTPMTNGSDVPRELTGPPPAAAPFDPCGPLPGTGITVLEASAGTGKTFTIAALVARLVAEGKVQLDQILAVTFTRMATAELRDRVRSRLVSAEEQLGRFVDAGQIPPADDALCGLLVDADGVEVAARRKRLSDAVATFDGATITTTHGFCQMMLASLGVAGQVAVGATLIEDAADVVEQTVDDLFLRGVRRWGHMPFGRQTALTVARTAVANPDTPLLPEKGEDPPGFQRRIADGVRKEVERRLRDANLLTYDDLLVRLRDTLIDPERGRQAADRLRERFKVVLVDEFQDTDPVQWDVVREAFGQGETTLILIGDPKQAIYSFRGADVYSYLAAADAAGTRLTLGENWRSDEPLLVAYDTFFDPLRFGHAEIPYRTVTAAPGHRQPGLGGLPVDAPLRVRMLHTADGLVRRTSQGMMQKDATLAHIANDLAADIVDVLEAGASVVAEDREIVAGDIAVLVRTNRHAGIVQDALREAGVPAVVGGTESVFGSPSARHWLRLLEALEQPSSRAHAAAVALTPFIGMTAAQVAGATEVTWDQLQSKLHRWADILRRRGVASLRRHVFRAEALPGRLLGEVSGERDLTDLTHVGQLLHAEGSAAQMGPPALRAWLASRIEEVGTDGGADADERSRRLDSDADAVQVLTVHRAKGLEFAVVYCPYLWDASVPPSTGRPVVFHDQDGRRTLDVGSYGNPPSFAEHFRQARDEQRGEDLRLLYVALTRARHQAVIWWARVKDSERSALGRMLMFRHPDGTVPADAKYSPKDADVERRLSELAARAAGRISVERCERKPPTQWRAASADVADLAAAAFDRGLDLEWRRTSYSSITAASHDELVASEPEAPGVIDEPPGLGADDSAVSGDRSPERPRAGATIDAAGPVGEDALRQVASPWAELPAGAEVGTLVHAVLERVDFAARDLPAAVSAAIAREQARRPVLAGAEEGLTAALLATLATPLGSVAAGRSLQSIGRTDRLDELGFELPLAGGDHPDGHVLLADVARLLADHHPAGGPLAGYADRLRSPPLLSHFRGYLTGSLDLVARFVDGDGPPRFVVVDYKTNWLAVEGEALSAWHYRPDALDAEMQQAHYPLQAVLYLVALHRYLRWRLPGYEPSLHLGGVLYLFLRGMVGAATPLVGGTPCGVFAWHPPAALVTDLSDLLDRGADRT